MQARTKQGLQTLRRAHAFLTAREYDVAMGTLAPHITTLASVVKQLETHAIEQDGRARSIRIRTTAKRDLARVLRKEYLRPIARLARSLFPDDTALQAGFQLPRRKDAEGLLQAAGGIAERAAEHKERFIAKGLSPDFVERLRRATEQYRDAIVGRGLDVGRRSAASAGLIVDLARGREVVRLIDDMLAPRLASQPELLAEWRSITRFTRQGGAESTGASLETPTQETVTPVSISPVSTSPATPTPATTEALAA